MRILFTSLFIGTLLASMARAGEEGVTGYWKFSLFQEDQMVPLWLVHFDKNKEGKPTADIEPLRGAPRAKVEEVKLVGDLIQMKLLLTVNNRGKAAIAEFAYEGKLPKPGAKKIYGSVTRAGDATPVVLEATSAKTAFELDRDLVLRTPSDPRAMSALVDLIDQAKENKADAKDVQSWVDASLRAAEQYGPSLQSQQQIRLLEALKNQKTLATVAVETARKVSKDVDPGSPMERQLEVLSAAASVLRANDQKDDLRAIESRLDKLESQAFTDYAKTALPFKTRKYTGRKASNDRAVLLELFTGAQCPPCVGADLAFDGIEKTYGPGEVVLLQYHVHIPAPDPLSTADTESRFEYYAVTHKIGGTPASLFNGKPEVKGGGSRDAAEEIFREYAITLNRLLESPPAAKVSATALRKENKVAIVANVANLANVGIKVRLRLALVEDWVRYRGSNGMRYHHRVVRAMPGGADGIPLKEKASEHKFVVDLTELADRINKYLDDAYPEGPRPMRFRNLSVVAFVQNDDTTEVLQAINVPVREE